MLLRGKNAIITGARKGIGRTTVEVFAKNGANIWACARKYDDGFESDMSKLSETYGVDIYPLYGDIGDENQIKSIVRKIRETKKCVDILVNTAGTVEDSTSFNMTSMEKVRNVFEVNFFGLTLLTQYVSRLMIREKKGSIISVSSVAGIDGIPAQYEYASSKAAIIGGTRELARELANYQIRVNAIAPGITNTDMGNKIAEELKKKIISSTMLGRVAEPEEISNVILFLASDLSSYITGQVIRVDGGM